MGDYIRILKFVCMDVVSLVFTMVFLDWVDVKFFENGWEKLLEKVLEIGGNRMGG